VSVYKVRFIEPSKEMEEYRSSVLGRALADVLQEIMENLPPSATLTENGRDIGDEMFQLFDEILQEEFKKANKKDSNAMPNTFTHANLHLHGQVNAYNNYENQWSVECQVQQEDLRLGPRALSLDLPHHVHTIPLLMKLHQN
jgi:hypothetical protein